MFHRKAIITLVFPLVFAFGAWAQTPPQHQHSETVIDGAKNPELIPDSTAYRLWFITVSALPNATQQDRDRQRAHLASLQLSALDNLQLITILAEFKSQYNGLIERYNESAKAALANGGRPDVKLFLQQIDELVQTTRTAIALRLPDSASRVDARVQEQKKHIQLHTQVHTMTTGGGQ